MDKDNLIDFLKRRGTLEIFPDGDFKIHSGFSRFKNNKNLEFKEAYDSLMTLTETLPEEAIISERFYCLLNNLKERPKDIFGNDKYFSIRTHTYKQGIVKKGSKKRALVGNFQDKLAVDIETFEKEELISLLLENKYVKFFGMDKFGYKNFRFGKHFAPYMYSVEKYLPYTVSIIKHTSFLPEELPIRLRLLFLMNGIEKAPKCKMCHNNVMVRRNKFMDHCSASCAYSDPERLRKCEETNFKKFGVYHTFQRKDIIEKTHSKKAIEKKLKTQIKRGHVRAGGFDLKAQPLFWNLHDRLEGLYTHLRYATKETRDISNSKNTEHCVVVSHISESFSRKLDFYVELKNGRKVNIEYDSHKKYTHKNFAKALQREQEILTIIPDLIILSVRSNEYSENPEKIEDSLFETILKISESSDFSETPKNFLSFTKFDEREIRD
jgi:hypothetical protein